MPSGHGVSKPNKADHPGRQVHPDRFKEGYTNLVTGVTHTLTENGYQSAEPQAFVDPMGNPTPAHARSEERYNKSMFEGYHDLPLKG